MSKAQIIAISGGPEISEEVKERYSVVNVGSSNEAVNVAKAIAMNSHNGKINLIDTRKGDGEISGVEHFKGTLSADHLLSAAEYSHLQITNEYVKCREVSSHLIEDGHKINYSKQEATFKKNRNKRRRKRKSVKKNKR